MPSDFWPPSRGERERARAELNLKNDEIAVNMVGRLDGEKGLDTVVEALASLRLDGSGVVFLIAGDGSLSEWFRSRVAKLEISSAVRFLGRIDRAQVRRLQHASDYHLYAGTISCGVSICLLEAMASGVVPIASDVPRGERELIGDSGWTFPAGNAQALRSALNAALEQSGDRPKELCARSAVGVRSPALPQVPELVGRSRPGRVRDLDSGQWNPPLRSCSMEEPRTPKEFLSPAPSRVLVTGGFGFLGGHLVEALLRAGVGGVHVVDNLSSNPVSEAVLLSELSRPDAVTYDLCTVADYIGDSPEDFDAVFHLASVVGPAGVLAHGGRIVSTVVTDTYLLAEYAAERRSRLDRRFDERGVWGRSRRALPRGRSEDRPGRDELPLGIRNSQAGG